MENEKWIFKKSLHNAEILYLKAHLGAAQKLAGVFELGTREINTYKLSFHICTATL